MTRRSRVLRGVLPAVMAVELPLLAHGLWLDGVWLLAIMIVTSEIATANLAHPEVDDVLDDPGEIVLKKRGEAIVVPIARMPTNTGAAAIYRF